MSADIWVYPLLLLLTVVFAWPVAALEELPNSTDFILQYYPNLAFLARNLHAGVLPLWNPTLFAGTPYLADPQSQLLYFPNWPFLMLLDLETAARAIIIFHFALAAVAAYLYLRHLRLPVLPATLGAVVYGLGPYATGQVAWLPMLISMAWMPLALLFFEQALQRRSLLRAVLAGVVLALQFFNGWPHGSYITGFALFALLVWHVGSALLGHHRGAPMLPTKPAKASIPRWRVLVELVALAAATGITFLGLAAPVILPFLEFWGLSNYATDRGAEVAASEGNVTVLALLGVGGSEGHGAYLSVAALVLASLGVLYGKDRRRWLFLALAGFALLVAFGANTPLYGALYRWIPGFRTFHVPGRFVVLFVLAASILAAMGADALSHVSGRRLAVSAVAASLALAAIGWLAVVRMLGPGAPSGLVSNLLHPDAGPFIGAPIATHIAISLASMALFVLALATNRVPKPAAVQIALLMVCADLFLFQGKDADYFSKLPLALREPSPMPAIERLAGEKDFRLAGFQQNGTIDFMSDFPFNVNSALVPPNFGLLYGAEDLQGYLPLRLRSYAEYLAAVNGGEQDYHWALVRNFQSPLLDMLNMRYVMVRDNDERLRNVTIATNLDVRPGHAGVVHPNPIAATDLQVHSYLGNAVNLGDGHVVARVKVTSTSGGTLSFDLKAGVDTAEWGYDRPEIAAVVKHSRAPIAQTRNLPASTHVYAATFTFPAPITITQVAVEQVEPSVELAVSEIVAVPANPVDRYESLGEINGATLYRNRLALPRVLMVPRAEAASSPADALAKIQSPGFDPRKAVVLEGTGIPTVDGAKPGRPGDTAIRSRGPNGLSLAVSTASPGFLLLNELSYPGWKAYLDGRPVKVWRANYLFRAIEVPPGEHDVDFRFEPDSLKLGLVLTASTVALLLASAVLRLKYRQKKENILP